MGARRAHLAPKDPESIPGATTPSSRWRLDDGGHIDDALSELRRARFHVVRLRKDPKLRKRLLRQVAETERALAERAAR
jgi:hypothetical protein